MVKKTKRKVGRESSLRERSALRWSVEQRLALIDDRLFWLGEVNRTDLVRRFGVSLGQASADIARYLARGPKGVVYDKKAKRYVADLSFRPVMGPPDAARVLGELRLAEARILPLEETLLGPLLHFDVTPVPERPVDAFVLRAVVIAIRRRCALNVVYQSMSRPEPRARTLEPHALVHDGFRWHARSFDHETQTFRDFVLGRMTRPALGAPARTRPEDDRDWQSFVTLKIAPHPAFTPAQAKAIAQDYGMTGGKGEIRVRRALLYYALKRLGLDVPPDARPPEQQHIVLVNREEIERLRPPLGEQ